MSQQDELIAEMFQKKEEQTLREKIQHNKNSHKLHRDVNNSLNNKPWVKELDDLRRKHCVDLSDLDRSCLDMNCNEGNFYNKLIAFISKKREEAKKEERERIKKASLKEHNEIEIDWEYLKDNINSNH